jgi:hypothetical protein
MARRPVASVALAASLLLSPERRRRLRDGGFSARSGGTDLAGLAILVC